jgi:hypothetical protein
MIGKRHRDYQRGFSSTKRGNARDVIDARLLLMASEDQNQYDEVALGRKRPMQREEL